jgi:hypothetical protein
LRRGAGSELARSSGFRYEPAQRFPATDFIYYGEVNTNFVPGTFGSCEEYNGLSQSQSFVIHHLKDIISVYNRNPYLFISAGSGGGAGFMYLDWVIVTYGVPYVVSVS